MLLRGGRNKLQHVASILAELLDNDNDGCADDPNVLAKLLKPLDKAKKTFLLPNKEDDDFEDKEEQFLAAGGTMVGKVFIHFPLYLV